MIRTMLLSCVLLPAALAAQGAAAPTPPKPEIFIRSPANGAVVPATFPVVFGLRNYGVAPAGVKVEGTGHFHLLINEPATAAGTIIPKDSVHLHYGAGQIETRVTLKPGKYTLRLVLGDFEHKVIGPDLVSAPIHVTVK